MYEDILLNNNNNCLKSNIQCIEIRVQWTVHLRLLPIALRAVWKNVDVGNDQLRHMGIRYP